MKLPREVSGKQAVRAFERLGFSVVRQKGSHVRMNKGTTHVTVPNHESVLPKTLQAMLRQAGISVDDFIDAL